MTDAGLDGLFLATGTNLCHLSGYPSVETTLARPFFLLLPRIGSPVLVVHTGRIAEARRYSWIDDVRAYAELSVAPIAELERAFADTGLARGRVGAELGFEQRLGVPLLEFERIRAALPRATFDDAANVLWRLRMVKAAWEIDAVRRACSITTAAYEATFGVAVEGMVDRAAARQLETAMVEGGGQAPWVLITSGAGNYELATGAPIDRELEAGDMLWFDAGCRVDGFWSDFSRAGVIGEPTPFQRDAQRTIVELTARGVALIRPGVPVADIAAEVDAGVRSIGIPVIARTSELAGRVGHGIGNDVTEPPHVSALDPTILEAGMIISIEPGIATDEGLFHAEENVLVTPDGHELLSVCPPELRTLAYAAATA